MSSASGKKQDSSLDREEFVDEKRREVSLLLVASNYERWLDYEHVAENVSVCVLMTCVQ